MRFVTPILKLTLLLIFAVGLTTSALHSQESYSVNKPVSIKMYQLMENESPQTLVDVLIEGNVDEILEYIQSVGGKYKYTAGNLVAARIPVGGAESSSDYKGIKRIDPVHGKIIPMDNLVDTNNHVWQAREGLPPLDQKYTGKGVVIGFLDTGIELGHPDFWKNDSTTRVRYIWDQTISSGPHIPPQFGYGNECDSTEINSGNCSHKDNNGHGTKVSGLAAGNGRTDSNFTGVAPDVDIVVVKVDLGSSFLTNVVDGVNYIFKKADELGKPVVINASLGTYAGSHDGKDLAAKAIDYMLTEKPGRMMVGAVGNEGDQNFHLGYKVTSDTNFTWFKHNNQLGLTYFELWADTADFNNVNFRLSADAPGTFKTCYKDRFLNIDSFNLQPGIGILKDSIKTPHGNCIGIATYYIEQVDDSYVMDVVIRPDSTNYLFRFATYGKGRFDLWSHPSLTGTSQIVSNIPTITEYPEVKYYRMPDNKQSMVSSWACSPNVLTIGSYVNRESYVAYNGNTIPQPGIRGELVESSSLGPTRTGLIKPDLVASGQFAMTTLPLWERNSFLNNNQNKLASSGWHMRFGGTSSSAPIVSGAVALYLQQNPNAYPDEIIKAFTETALTDSMTGIVPNIKAGYGKLNVFGALTIERGCTDPDAANYNPDAIIEDGSCEYDTAATGILAVKETSAITVFPNPIPFNGHFTADVSQLPNGGTIAVFNMEGRQLIRQNFTLSDRKLKFDAGNWPAGVYLINIYSQKGENYQARVIKP